MAEQKDWSSKLWWSLPAATILVLICLALFFGEPPIGKLNSTYDGSPAGFRAAYLLLDELGYPVVRSRQVTGGSVRFLLFPEEALEKAAAVDTWVRGGGIAILADSSLGFAFHLGLRVKLNTSEVDPGFEPASGPDVTQLAGGKVYMECKDAGEVWARAADQPFVSIYPRERGEIWLIHRPQFLMNGSLSRADNGVLLCRLAEEALRRRPGPIAFDEFFHGLRERPGVLGLLLRPPTLWITLQSVLLVSLLLWHFAPRFGSARDGPAVRRRSREEFLDAMAALLERKGDYQEAYRIVREDLVRTLERDLGLPAGTRAEDLLAEATRRRPVRPEALRRVLAGSALPARASQSAFVQALRELEDLRDECFDLRHHR